MDDSKIITTAEALNVSKDKKNQAKKLKSNEDDGVRELRLKKADRFALMSNLINCKNYSTKLPTFPLKYLKVTDFMGEEIAVEILPHNVIRPLRNLRKLTADIVRFSNNELQGNPLFRFDDKEANSCSKYWDLNTPPIKEIPAIVSWFDDPGYCYNRLPWRFNDVKDKPTPLWDELLSRIEINRDAFCHYIASMFYLDSYRQQYLWIHGSGSDGKGVILKMIKKMFSTFSYSAKPPVQNQEIDRYIWHFAGSRVLSFDEVKDYSIATLDWLKAITGDSDQTMKPHHEKSIAVDLNVKIIFTANGAPEISSQTSDTRRLIYVKLRPSKITRRKNYDEDLWKEFGSFLAKCIINYNKVYPDHFEIAVDEESFAEVSSFLEAEHAAFFDGYFEMDENSILINTKLTPFLKNHFPRTNDRKLFTRWLHDKYNFKMKTIRTGNKRIEGIKGLKLKNIY